MKRNSALEVAAILSCGIILIAVAMAAVPLSSSSGPENTFAFNEVSSDAGFEYTSDASDQFGNQRTGVYVSDYDRNGYPDVLAIGGDRPTLFTNTGGAFEPSGKLSAINVTIKGALFFDYDNDGWDDLLLLAPSENPLFFENDAGHYDRRDVGFSDRNFTMPVSASAADYDTDGCLDVFIAQNGHWVRNSPKKELEAMQGAGKTAATEIEVEDDNGYQNYLFRGDCGNGTFEDVTDEAGIVGTRWTTVTSFADVTGDGLPDIHAANDFNYDYLYINQNGTGFEAHKITGTNRHAMSSEVADFNRDGRMDIFETNVYYDNRSWTLKSLESMDANGNLILLSSEYVFTSSDYEVTDGGWGWAAAATDFDNDGDRDLIHATKYYRNGSERSDRIQTYPRVWSRNDEVFTRMNSSAIGLEPTNGRGIARLDFDRDGDQDIIVANVAGKYKLYENQHTGGHWLQIAVRGDHDTPAIGTMLQITVNNESRWITVNARADLLSQDTRTSHVGLRDAKSATIVVTWPDGMTHQFEDIEANQRVVLYPNGTVTTQ